MKKTLIIYLDPDLRTVVEQTAKREGRSMSAEMCHAFREYVERQNAVKKLGVKP